MTTATRSAEAQGGPNARAILKKECGTGRQRDVLSRWLLVTARCYAFGITFLLREGSARRALAPPVKSFRSISDERRSERRERAILAPFAAARSRVRLSCRLSRCGLRCSLPRTGRQRGHGDPIAAPTDLGLLPADQWDRLDSAVDRGLSFLSREQQPDGSFPTWADGQPGVTSLCIMAFLARGHQPGKGPYGPQIERAIDYVLEMQDQRVGASWPTDGSAARSFASRTAKIARLPAITTMELPA